jgi:cobalt-precorrin-5B (C1)-methyltransferase
MQDDLNRKEAKIHLIDNSRPGKILRSGYTTGACAAAASKAATLILLSNVLPGRNSINALSCTSDGCSEVGIPFPDGQRVVFKLNECSISTAYNNVVSATAEIIKDAGDDPDITDKAKIRCTVEFVKSNNLADDLCGRIETLKTAIGSLDILIDGGSGVGTVTKPGLPVPVGYPAINPVPLKMIKDAVREAFDEDCGFSENVENSYRDDDDNVRSVGVSAMASLATRHKGIPESDLKNGTAYAAGLENKSENIAAEQYVLKVTIGVADGEMLAKKTLNSRLGIEGGLSILGTTGIVKPVSAEAWMATISASMSVAKAMNMETIVLSSGRSSEKAHQNRFAFPEESYAMMGDYIEFSLLEAKRNGFTNIHVCAQLAKLVKMAMAMPQTHVKYGAIDPKMAADFIAEIAEDNLSKTLIEEKLSGENSFNTVREIFGCIQNDGSLLEGICNKAKRYVNDKVGAVSATVFLISYDGEIIAQSI